MPKWIPTWPQLATGVITGVASWAALEFFVKPTIRGTESTLLPPEQPSDLARRNANGTAANQGGSWYNPLSWF